MSHPASHKGRKARQKSEVETWEKVFWPDEADEGQKGGGVGPLGFPRRKPVRASEKIGDFEVSTRKPLGTIG